MIKTKREWNNGIETVVDVYSDEKDLYENSTGYIYESKGEKNIITLPKRRLDDIVEYSPKTVNLSYDHGQTYTAVEVVGMEKDDILLCVAVESGVTIGGKTLSVSSDNLISLDGKALYNEKEERLTGYDYLMVNMNLIVGE